MSESAISDLLRPLADSAEDYEYERGAVLIMRHGIELALQAVTLPGVGPCIKEKQGDREECVPLRVYVQKTLLRLPTLSAQIVRAVDRGMASRLVSFIEAPAEFSTDRDRQKIGEVSKHLQSELEQSIPGETRVYQLMASAGQGKTILLESVARDLARAYVPMDYPKPLLLNVDLLGRYVGTLDDAIAGSLNNTYVFPSLTQRDVAYCIRQGWIVLALDGFDELVARVGTRDAFLRLNDLLEQLEGHGTILVSARESFFDLYQVSTAIRQYVQPRRGSYSTTTISLQPWTRAHAARVFEQLKSRNAQRDVDELLKTFGDDEALALHPFFLPRLASLWIAGERFAEVGTREGLLERTRYVVDTFIRREVEEKWVDREAKPILNLAGHAALLGVIAEEMWRSGAFKLDRDELRLAAEVALNELGITDERAEPILNRVPTHAALAAKGQLYGFLHDRFFYYYLGLRLAELLRRKDFVSLRLVFSTGEIAPDVLVWAASDHARNPADASNAVLALNAICAEPTELLVRQNASSYAAQLVTRCVRDGERRTHLVGMSFSGDALREQEFVGVDFSTCSFGHCDFKASKFDRCTFNACSFGDLLVNSETAFRGSSFLECQFHSICDADAEFTLFEPHDIEKSIVGYGGRIVRKESPPLPGRPAFPNPAVVSCVERFVRLSERRTDIAIDDLMARYADHVQEVVRVGLHTGIFKSVEKSTSGPKKHFVRFAVDRSRLLRGQVEETADPLVDRFWAELRSRYSKRK